MGIGNMTKNALGAVASAWRKDKDFRARMEADPKAALAEKGVDVPAEDVRVAVDKEDNLHVVVPTDPNGEMSDEALKMVSGGINVPMPGGTSLNDYMAEIEQSRSYNDWLTSQR